MPPEVLEQRNKAKRQAMGGEWGILAKIKKVRTALCGQGS
jgi:hypothetical protein